MGDHVVQRGEPFGRCIAVVHDGCPPGWTAHQRNAGVVTAGWQPPSTAANRVHCPRRARLPHPADNVLRLFSQADGARSCRERSLKGNQGQPLPKPPRHGGRNPSQRPMPRPASPKPRRTLSAAGGASGHPGGPSLPPSSPGSHAVCATARSTRWSTCRSLCRRARPCRTPGVSAPSCCSVRGRNRQPSAP